MNDRARAIGILHEAREILVQRLTERILEAREEILDDAHGYCFVGEIDAIHEQVGHRLGQVNSLLASLPPLESITPHHGFGDVSTVEVGASVSGAAAYLTSESASSGMASDGDSSGLVGANSHATHPLYVHPIRDRELESVMDKKAKHKIDVLNQKLQKLRMQLAGARKQMDDPADITRLESEIAAATAEVEKLKRE